MKNLGLSYENKVCNIVTFVRRHSVPNHKIGSVTRNIRFKLGQLLFLLVLLVTMNVYSVKAQNSVSVIKMNDLSFGGLVAGSSVTILPTGPSAAMFQVSYSCKKQTDKSDDNGYHYGWEDITIQFNLPNQLMDNSHAVPVTFSNNSALWSNSTNISGAKSFDPKQQKELRIQKNKEIYIWLGGTVTTSLSSWSGKYSSMITMSINTIDN